MKETVCFDWVVDVVNAFKGDIDNGAMRHIIDGDSILYVVSESSYLREVHQVCTVDEFNQCVAEMSEAKWIPEKVNKMKTVGDFKKAGLVFVRGDLIDGETGNKTSNAICPFRIGYIGSVGDRVVADFSDVWTIRSFAWRENTGEKPSFSGLIEYETCDGIYNSGHTDCINFSVRIGGKTVIKKWRPSLNQSEQNAPDSETAKPDDKPIFTQAMAEAGELPPVGGEVSLRYKFDSKQIHITGKVLYSSREHCIIDGEHKECHYKMGDYSYEPIDTRTPKQKAVDDACKSIDYIDNPIITSIVSDLYDKGFIKC